MTSKTAGRGTAAADDQYLKDSVAARDLLLYALGIRRRNLKVEVVSVDWLTVYFRNHKSISRDVLTVIPRLLISRARDSNS